MPVESCLLKVPASMRPFHGCRGPRSCRRGSIASVRLKLLLRSLHEHGADYLLIGGYALAAHGYQRATTDIDVVVPATSQGAGSIRRRGRTLPQVVRITGNQTIDGIQRFGEVALECRKISKEPLCGGCGRQLVMGRIQQAPRVSSANRRKGRCRIPQILADLRTEMRDD